MHDPSPLSTLSLAHPNAPTLERAEVTRALGDAASAAKHLQELLDGADVFVLLTCLRIEVASQAPLEHLRSAMTNFIGPLASPMVGRSGRDATHHLLKVASGLDSAIVGEPEVLGQFRRAVEEGRSHGTLSGTFEQLLSAAIKTGRDIRRQLPDTPHASLSRVASDHIEGAERVAIFGAGAIANAVAKTLAPSSSHVTMYARRPEAVAVGVDAVDHINDAAQALETADAVVAATSAKRDLFDESEVRAAVSRRDTPLVIIDLAMPPDFSLHEDVDNVKYLGLDALAELVRPVAVPTSVDAMLDDATDIAERRYLNHRSAGPVIAGLLAEADRIAGDEAAKAFQRSDVAGSEEAFQELARRVARRLLHPTVSFLSGHERGSEAAPLLAEAYELAE